MRDLEPDAVNLHLPDITSANWFSIPEIASVAMAGFNQNRLAPCPGGNAIGLAFERSNPGSLVHEFARYFAGC
jgi:hypothetical protein